MSEVLSHLDQTKRVAVRESRKASRLIRTITAVFLLLACAIAWADLTGDRALFVEGWSAAGRADHVRLREIIDQLPDYSLTPYLEFELKRQTLESISVTEMTTFLARYRDWTFATRLETQWLRRLGERGSLEEVARYGRDARDTVVRCWVARSDIEADRHAGLLERINELWLVGRSQPRVCDPVFKWWRSFGHPSVDQGWERFRLALDRGEIDLARYLRRYLDTPRKQWADQWLEVRARPARLVSVARRWPDEAVARTIIADVLIRQARRDWAQADRSWQVLASRFSFSSAARASVEREIALFQAVALDPGAVAAIDGLPDSARDQQMLEWRARAAMSLGDWQAVLASIQQMELLEQGRSRWRYWRGRALAELRRPEALLAFGSLAAEATYYGFLSAKRLGQDLSLCPQDLVVDPQRQRRLMRDAEFERALELFQVGLIHHARGTWSRVWRRLSEAERRQAALLAAGQGWHDRAIAALGAAGLMRAYPWRFPLIEVAQVTEQAGRWGVDPALIYGLMRAESAMQTDALSPAGARGLLQLMPGTASGVARRNNLAYRGASDLMNPAVNIPLGVAHLSELQLRYDGDWVKVAAAYNAGANAVRRWLDERPQSPPDVWIETMPFFETRDYVPRVLAFATIYEWQLQRQPQVLAQAIIPERAAQVLAFSCPQ